VYQHRKITEIILLAFTINIPNRINRLLRINYEKDKNSSNLFYVTYVMSHVIFCTLVSTFDPDPGLPSSGNKKNSCHFLIVLLMLSWWISLWLCLFFLHSSLARHLGWINKRVCANVSEGIMFKEYHNGLKMCRFKWKMSRWDMNNV
jgi:hypothetical protein